MRNYFNICESVWHKYLLPFLHPHKLLEPHLNSSFVLFFVKLPSILFLVLVFVSHPQPSSLFSRNPWACTAVEHYSQWMIVIDTQTISVAFITSNAEKRTQLNEGIFCKGGDVERDWGWNIWGVLLLFFERSGNQSTRECRTVLPSRPKKKSLPKVILTIKSAQAKKRYREDILHKYEKSWKACVFQNKRAIFCFLFTLA